MNERKKEIRDRDNKIEKRGIKIDRREKYSHQNFSGVPFSHNFSSFSFSSCYSKLEQKILEVDDKT